jgi:hypothetical protein
MGESKREKIIIDKIIKKNPFVRKKRGKISSFYYEIQPL